MKMVKNRYIPVIAFVIMAVMSSSIVVNAQENSREPIHNIVLVHGAFLTDRAGKVFIKFLPARVIM